MFRLGLAASVLALCVVVLGAYVRLSHAGLGCPDWPGCYGHIDVPYTDQEIASANTSYPERPVEHAKAWKEMTHRYFAGCLGLIILLITIVAWRKRDEGISIALPNALVGLVVFQALLGMWTVTLLLKPLIVTAHLLGGMTTLALLWWLTLQHSSWQPLRNYSVRKLTVVQQLATVCLIVLILQIVLGGWTSTNYAALACYGFPDCNQQWLPAMDFSEAFVLWRGLGIDYEGGVLDHPARIAIHMMHRIGALTVFCMTALLIIVVFKRIGVKPLNRLCLLMLIVLFVQLSLGVINVTQGLPLFVATLHNAGAAILLLTLLSVIYALHSWSASSVRVR